MGVLKLFVLKTEGGCTFPSLVGLRPALTNLCAFGTDEEQLSIVQYITSV